MNRDFRATVLKSSIALAAVAALSVPLLGGCGVKGPLKLPTPPAATGTAPSAPQGAPATDAIPSAPGVAPAAKPSFEPKPDASPSSGAPAAAAPQPTERTP